MIESTNKSVNVNFRVTKKLRTDFYVACKKAAVSPSVQLRSLMANTIRAQTGRSRHG